MAVTLVLLVSSFSLVSQNTGVSAQRSGDHDELSSSLSSKSSHCVISFMQLYVFFVSKTTDIGVQHLTLQAPSFLVVIV